METFRTVCDTEVYDGELPFSICNLLSTIGILFADAGLRDLAVESGVIAEGSINNQSNLMRNSITELCDFTNSQMKR